MKRPMILLGLVIGVSLVVGRGAATPVSASAEVVEPQPMTVCVYENKNGWLPDGDELCTTAVPADLHRYNLTLVTTGLHDRCNGAGMSPVGWNDCISAIYIPSVTPGYRVRMYININYGIWRFCADGGGYWNLPYGTNDAISSFRVEPGSC